ncbi:MAG: TAXI family TRAP transporter solute-binding subunit [Burkholderiales bacterium]
MTDAAPDSPSSESPRRTLARGAVLVALLIVVALVGAWFLQSTIPRRIVLASGAADGMYHVFAQRYQAILARDGVTLVERITEGAAENAKLLRDPRSGVDVAFIQGGVVRPDERGDIVMLSSLYFEPLWVFYRGSGTLTELDELRGKRIAVGTLGSGSFAFVEPLLRANDVTDANTRFVPLANVAALQALQAGALDAIALVGSPDSPAVRQALHDTNLKLMSFARSDAYPRRFPHITKLTLPAGTIDFGLHIPPDDVRLIATEAMLASRDDLPPALVNLLLEAARELHSGQGIFESPREFPNTDPVDLPVSVDADRHHRFGPSLLHRYLPFFVATYVERLIVLLVPLLVILVPLVNLVPQLLRWRVRSRVYRWYGELALLERDVAARTGPPPIDQWLSDLNRIEQAAARIRTPASYASEAYTLREHIGLVRAAVMAKAKAAERGAA